jgi:two-component system cell cycle response regulator
VDNFKEFNDYFGHPQGDHCLHQIAEALQGSTNRPLDKVGRYGGEEFILVWYDTDENSARELAEATRSAITDLKISHGPGASQRRVTISLGVATCAPTEPADAGSLVRAADRALYKAKEAGRDRVMLAGEL